MGMRPARSMPEACLAGLDEADGVAESGEADGADEADVAGSDDGEGAGLVRHGRSVPAGR